MTEIELLPAVRLPSRQECHRRLQRVLPKTITGETVTCNPLAAAAVFGFLYVGAVGEDRRLRPTTILWLCDTIASHTTPENRHHYYAAAVGGNAKQAVEALVNEWGGGSHQSWYGDNSREPLRDETFQSWLRYGVVIRDETLPTTSPKPRWSLEPAFARLFDLDLQGSALHEAIESWQESHLPAAEQTRILLQRQLTEAEEAIDVQLPGGGGLRKVEPGPSSLIVQGVIEQLAPQIMDSPHVLAISESRTHVDVTDEELLESLSITIDHQRLLPDVLLFDVTTRKFCFVEAVATDGPIDEPRREALTGWAEDQGISSNSCRFITAFLSRTHDAFRRLVAHLAWNSEVWFLDEPENLMRLEDLRNEFDLP